jgi:hypothetical protein
MESVVAMLIMVSVVSVCFGIYGNVLEASQPLKRLDMKGKLLAYVYDCKSKQEYIDQRIEMEGYTINSTVLMGQWRNVYEWSVSVKSTAMRNPITHKELILLPNE